MSSDFSNIETKRQDEVDMKIMDLIVQLAPQSKRGEIDWDIEVIAMVRDALQAVLVDEFRIMTEQEFYPYRELGDVIDDPDENEVELIIVTEKELGVALESALDGMDAEALAMFAGDAIGGKCWFNTDGTYSFEPDETYMGGLDFIKGKN